jgi:ketosteroid isomerase-like protein
MSMTKSRFLATLGMTTALGMTSLPTLANAQQKEVDELLAADRAYAAAAAKVDIIAGLTPMFSKKVIMPVPGAAPKFADGIDSVVAALKANKNNDGVKLEWTPVRGGISADGQHGFTFGYMTVHKPDGTDAPAKYLSYWIKEGAEWKVAAYKRAGRAAGEVSTELMAPSLPAKMVAPSADAAMVANYSKSLGDAEQSFSDEAVVIGLGAAFRKYGRADAMNMGPIAAFTIGNEAISRTVEPPENAGKPSPVFWKSDHALMVASSGDLGISIGWIHRVAEPNGATFPFFTIWRRDNPTAPWRYIAE